jgi:Domain of unknown function (DUF4286)
MIVYNITIKIDPDIKEEWLQWQITEHIPEVMNTRLFTEYKFYKLLEQEEDESVTYVVQYFSFTAAHLEEYLQKYAPTLREKAFAKWGNKFIAFRTTMELVN